MTVQLEDVLLALCSRVNSAPGNERQRVYLVSDATEAELAADVLVSFGFDVKVYSQENDAKLYITQPADSQDAAWKLSAALAYAHSLKSIKQSLDGLCGDPQLNLPAPVYRVKLANAPGGGKQIVIEVAPGTQAPRAPAAFTSPPAAATAVSYSQPSMRKERKPEILSSGPQVGKSSYPDYLIKKNTQEKGFMRQMFLLVTGNIAPAGYGMLALGTAVALIFGLVVVVKIFLCPDFAYQKRNNAWYCKQQTADEDPEHKQSNPDNPLDKDKLFKHDGNAQ